MKVGKQVFKTKHMHHVDNSYPKQIFIKSQKECLNIIINYKQN
jgi:hypothetical protein